MKKSIQIALSALMVMILLFGCMTNVFALAVSNNPLVDSKINDTFAETEDEFFNILIMGIDQGHPGYWGSGGKKELAECHSDQNILVSLNLTQKKLNLISVPRDSLTYIPGKLGIYKLNSTFSCADTIEDGIQNVVNSVSWYLGNIKIDRYCAVNMKTMVALGDAMGGVDFEIDMNYTGSSGKYFKKGMQHLDGQSIMDYVRARRNATVDGHDIGRTRRGRAMMTAIFQKLYTQPELVNDLYNVINDSQYTFLTNVTMEDFVQFILPAFLTMDPENVGSYFLDGKYRQALIDWNFHFINQDARKQVLKDAFGIEAEEIPYISYNYTKWLTDNGLMTVRYIHVARELIAAFQAVENPTENQAKLLEDMIAAHDACVAAFDKAADSQDAADTKTMRALRKELRDIGEKATTAFKYTKKVDWFTNVLWYNDPYINEWRPIWQ